MSTRSCIARLTSKEGEPITFSGTYHHWDGYPSGLGSTLYKLFRGYFKRDIKAMLKCLIDDRMKGWETINSADFNLPAEPRPNDNLRICSICNKPEWMHYSQYHTEDCRFWIEAGRPKCPPEVSGTLVTDHFPNAIDAPHGPYCFEEIDGAEPVTEENAADKGCEYVYAFTPDGKTMVVLSSYIESGEKMIGMFGHGDPNATWKVIGEINLRGKPPKDWDAVPLIQPETPKRKTPAQIRKEKEAAIRASNSAKAKAEAVKEFKKTGIYDLIG